jgi:hypothetical protein
MGPTSKLKSLLKIADILYRLNKANYAKFEGIAKPCICSKAQFISLAPEMDVRSNTSSKEERERRAAGAG